MLRSHHSPRRTCGQAQASGRGDTHLAGQPSPRSPPWVWGDLPFKVRAYPTKRAVPRGGGGVGCCERPLGGNEKPTVPQRDSFLPACLSLPSRKGPAEFHEDRLPSPRGVRLTHFTGTGTLTPPVPSLPRHRTAAAPRDFSDTTSKLI